MGEGIRLRAALAALAVAPVLMLQARIAGFRKATMMTTFIKA